jgi:hypothetical protein
MLINQTPGNAIRKTCLDCAGSPSAVRDCQGDKLYDGPCLFVPYRFGKGRPSVKLIRKRCLWCMGGSPKLVKDCKSSGTCQLHSYRFGTNPKKEAVRSDFPTRIDERAGGNGQVRVEAKLIKITSKTATHEGESRAQI